MRKKLLFYFIVALSVLSLLSYGLVNNVFAKENKKKCPTLTYIGHSTVKITSKYGKVLYIDPYYEPGDYSKTADYILVTHEHEDHNVISLCKSTEKTTIIRSANALKDGKYVSYDFGEFKIEAVAAGGNENHSITDCVGYIVTVNGVKVYHSGDTSTIDEMKSLKAKHIDYAMYPIDGIYNMDAIEATKVANLVNAKHNIPVHPFDENGSNKAENFTPKGKLSVNIGETINLKK